MAYYFAGGAGKPAGDKELAKKWLGIVAQSALSDEELKTLGVEGKSKLSDAQITEYGIDTNLVKTFLSICNYYNKVGQEDKVTGEIQYSYADFWDELNTLVEEQPQTVSTESRERLTQLRLLDDISYQLYSNAANFVSDAGIDEQTFIAALDAIYDRIEKANTGSNQTARSVQQNTLTTIENTRRTVDSLYAQNSQALKSGGDQ